MVSFLEAKIKKLVTLKKDDIHFLFFYLPLGPCQIVRVGGGGLGVGGDIRKGI